MAIGGLKQGQNSLDASTIIIPTPCLSKYAQLITATILWGDSRPLPLSIFSGGLFKSVVKWDVPASKHYLIVSQTPTPPLNAPQDLLLH